MSFSWNEDPNGWESYIPLSAEAVRRSAERNVQIIREAWERLQAEDDG